MKPANNPILQTLIEHTTTVEANHAATDQIHPKMDYQQPQSHSSIPCSSTQMSSTE